MEVSEAKEKIGMAKGAPFQFPLFFRVPPQMN